MITITPIYPDREPSSPPAEPVVWEGWSRRDPRRRVQVVDKHWYGARDAVMRELTVRCTGEAIVVRKVGLEALKPKQAKPSKGKSSTLKALKRALLAGAFLN